MAKNTDKSYRNQVIYSVFVRNYSAEGTFEGVRRDLQRIKDLGTDIIWLMPIHPTGEKARKGKLGSPYAIRDYRAVNPEFGTLEDFRRLVDGIHALGMKCIIDVVYNHTSPDSVLSLEHPEWFYHKPDGSFGNRVGDWWDIIDLDYSQPGLWDYQIETLKYWASQGVDGFRCDVAPMVPLDFWLRAREEVEQVRPGCFWLAESVEYSFIKSVRGQGMGMLSDAELYQAFDACYDYDIFDMYRGYLEGRVPLERYAEAINRQEVIYPDNYVKLRCLENHDQPRAAFLIPDWRARSNWIGFLYFQKGITLIYNGQEAGCDHRPDLFDKDGIDWSRLTAKEDQYQISGTGGSCQLKELAEMKRHPLFTDSQYEVKALPHDILLATHRKGDRQLVGIFSMRGDSSLVRVDVPDGQYADLVYRTEPVEVYQGLVSVSGSHAIIFEAPCQ